MEYMLCPECGKHYSSDASQYCPDDGKALVLIDKGPVASSKEFAKALVRLEVESNRFGLLRFMAGLITFVGIALVILGWIIPFATFGNLKNAAPASLEEFYPGISYSIAFMIWVLLNLLGLFSIAGGQYLEMQISQYNHIRELTGIVRVLGTMLTRER